MRCKRIDWVEAEKSGSLDKFASEIRTRIEPLPTRVHDNGEVISNDIEQVAGLLIDTAEMILPCVQPRRRTKWRDEVLNCLCVQSLQARAAWRDAESREEGPLSEEKNRLWRAMRKRVRWCAARSKRLRVQKRDRCLLPRIVKDSRSHKRRSLDVLSWL